MAEMNDPIAPQPSAAEPAPATPQSPAAPQAAAAQHPPAAAATPAARWAAAFQEANGREPTMSEYQEAVAGGEIERDRDPSVQQMSAGIRQIMTGAKGLYESKVAPTVERSGAKEFLTDRVTPAARKAMNTTRQRIEEQPHGQSEHVAKWLARAPLILIGAAFFAIISLFLPAVSAYGRSLSYFNGGPEGEGALLLVIFLLVMATAVVSIMMRKRWAVITTGVVAVVCGLLGAGDGFGTMANMTGVGSVGFGLVLLATCSTLIVMAGVAVLLTLRRSRAVKAPGEVAGPQAQAPHLPPAQEL